LRKKYWYVLICTLIVVALFAIIVHAFNVSWSTSVSVTTTNPNIKVYWDSACTNPVTSIPLGNVQRGATKYVTLYIKNEGGGTIDVYWNSTLSYQTDQITDNWQYMGGGGYYVNLNGMVLPEGTTKTTRYSITVSPTATLQEYNWILNLGG
jgi:hypothetical protein